MCYNNFKRSCLMPAREQQKMASNAKRAERRDEKVSRVIMMCGLCGSGKTTYAKEREKEGYIRLSIDERMWTLYGREVLDMPHETYTNLEKQVEKELREEMLQQIAKGKDVILDFSFWSKDSRSTYRRLIREAGGTDQLVYLKADKELLRRRLRCRFQHPHANGVPVTDERLEQYWAGFQEPQGEGEMVIDQNGEC